jgi:hypothetical protein
MEIDSWLTGKRGISLPFTDACEPLYQNPDSLRWLISETRALALKRHWGFIEHRSGDGFPTVEKPSISYYSHTLVLVKNTQKLFQQCSASTRRAKRKAEKAGLTVARSQSLESLAAYYRLHSLTRQRHGLPPQPWRFFESLHRHVISPGNGSIFLALDQNARQPIAGAVFLHQGLNALYKFGASDHRFQLQRPSNLVMWKAIEWLAQNAYQKLDFGRTSLGNEGLRHFKRGWGASEKTVSYYRIDPKSNRIDIQSDQTNGWHIRFFRALPIPLAQLAGQLLYRHVG